MNNQPIKLIECPRDAMQGWKTSIPAARKAANSGSGVKEEAKFKKKKPEISICDVQSFGLGISDGDLSAR